MDDYFVKISKCPVCGKEQGIAVYQYEAWADCFGWTVVCANCLGDGAKGFDEINGGE